MGSSAAGSAGDTLRDLGKGGQDAARKLRGETSPFIGRGARGSRVGATPDPNPIRQSGSRDSWGRLRGSPSGRKDVSDLPERVREGFIQL